MCEVATQLGVDGNGVAATVGGLAGKPQFFGAGVAEVVSARVSADVASWNGDWGQLGTAIWPWAAKGGAASYHTGSGVFSQAAAIGGGDVNNNMFSHRTILLGY